MSTSQDVALSIMQRAQGIVRCLEIYRNETPGQDQNELVGSLQAIKECLDDDWRVFLADAERRPHAKPMTPEQLANRNARISEGQAKAWTDPEIRRRRTNAITDAWDDALRRALMSNLKTAKKEKK